MTTITLLSNTILKSMSHQKWEQARAIIKEKGMTILMLLVFYGAR